MQQLKEAYSAANALLRHKINRGGEKLIINHRHTIINIAI